MSKQHLVANKYATLVYQAGIANVFTHERELRADDSGIKGSHPVRLMQSDFRTCESFARGLQCAGVIVRSAWCNKPGDITNEQWHFSNLSNAPFSDRFCPVE